MERLTNESDIPPAIDRDEVAENVGHFIAIQLVADCDGYSKEYHIYRHPVNEYMLTKPA